MVPTCGTEACVTPVRPLLFLLLLAVVIVMVHSTTERCSKREDPKGIDDIIYFLDNTCRFGFLDSLVESV
jgi:hypothetical protein